jgi:hypothetical protein
LRGHLDGLSKFLDCFFSLKNCRHRLFNQQVSASGVPPVIRGVLGRNSCSFSKLTVLLRNNRQAAVWKRCLGRPRFFATRVRVEALTKRRSFLDRTRAQPSATCEASVPTRILGLVWWKTLRIKRLFQLELLFDTQKIRVVTSIASLAPRSRPAVPNHRGAKTYPR